MKNRIIFIFYIKSIKKKGFLMFEHINKRIKEIIKNNF